MNFTFTIVTMHALFFQSLNGLVDFVRILDELGPLLRLQRDALLAGSLLAGRLVLTTSDH